MNSLKRWFLNFSSHDLVLLWPQVAVSLAWVLPKLTAPREGTNDLETPSGQQLWGNPLAYYLFVLQGGPERCCRAGCQQGAWQRMTKRGGSSSVAAAGLVGSSSWDLGDRHRGRGCLREQQRRTPWVAHKAVVGTSLDSRCMAGQEKFLYLLEDLRNYWAILGELCYDKNSSKWPTYYSLLVWFRAQKRIGIFFPPSLSAFQQVHSKVVFSYKGV